MARALRRPVLLARPAAPTHRNAPPAGAPNMKPNALPENCTAALPPSCAVLVPDMPSVSQPRSLALRGKVLLGGGGSRSPGLMTLAANDPGVSTLPGAAGEEGGGSG